VRCREFSPYPAFFKRIRFNDTKVLPSAQISDTALEFDDGLHPQGLSPQNHNASGNLPKGRRRRVIGNQLAPLSCRFHEQTPYPISRKCLPPSLRNSVSRPIW
jgi:hypothetical protein